MTVVQTTHTHIQSTYSLHSEHIRIFKNVHDMFQMLQLKSGNKFIAIIE